MASVQTPRNLKWTERYPDIGTGPVPVEPYISREYFEKERDRIFSKVWLNVGRIEQIPNAGDYFVKELAVCKTSIIIVRGKDGTVRAFHNMCTHRGNQLVWDSKGTCRAFTCRFHGWVYNTDGSLRHVTDEDNFFDMDKASMGMSPVSADVWNGFIFINIDANPSESLSDYLGTELQASIEGYPFDKLSGNCFSWYTDVNANWKVAHDAFAEIYHIPTLHHRMIGNVYASKSNPWANALEFALYDKHGRVSLAANPEWNPTAVETLAGKFGDVVLQQVNTDKASFPPGVNPTDAENWSFDGISLFPNCLLYVSNATYLTHTFWPLAEDRCRWEIRTYSPRAANLAGRFSQEYGKCFFRDTLLEDGSTLERTQTMLMSGVKKEIYLQDQELILRHRLKVAERYINA
ncbi:MAG: phenylpropionate dioxygenase-like ring-hydroxylating dioxygenase large terminal subunit [Gammaproteobacteria bacterium]|jgi:phenylpropionate dioxygenase-like ring-hydroxylating dioxygenase large terminal subunit